MTTDYFMKVDGIEGESTDRAHQHEIELDGFSFGASAKGGMVGQGSARAQFSDVTVHKQVDMATTELLKVAAAGGGSAIAKVVITCRKASSNNQLEYLIITLTDVHVSNWQLSGGGGIPREQIELSFARIEITYVPQAETGLGRGKKTAAWDRRQNK